MPFNVQWLSLAKSFAAFEAAIALNYAVFVGEFPETLGFALTAVTVQTCLSGKN
jgi:hypothetical protein